MNRTIWTRSCVLLLCGLVLTAGWAAKTPKTPKTAQEIANFRRNHPDAAQAQPPRPSPVSPAPYVRPGVFGPNGQVNLPPASNPQTRPNQGGHNQDGSDHGGQNQGGHPIDDDHRWNYPPHQPGQPDRAYPENHGWDNHDRHDNDRDHHNDNHRGGGWSVQIVVPACLPVPQYYVPAPQYIPAPAPRCGGGFAYYPQYIGPWYAPDCGDITRFPLLGCEIIAADGTFLGVIDRAYGSPESIANRNSAYGSPYSQLSLWNPEGPYGNPDAPYSPWNRNSYRPPVLYWHGQFRGYLSINPDLQPKVSPASLPEHIKVSPWR